MHAALPQLPFSTADVAPIGGRIRHSPEDFEVHEELAYAPSGTGEHLFVRFEKRGMTTPDAVHRLAAALGVDRSASSWAGLKDKNAVTTQWASFQGADPSRAEAATVEGIRVLGAIAHTNKLRTGHVRANRFVIAIRDVPSERASDVQAVLARLASSGMPNYFGSQRFGLEGRNLSRARGWLLERGRPPSSRFEQKLLVSVLQAALFNEVLAERVTEGLLHRAIDGDLFRKEDTGGLFTVPSGSDEHAEMERRVAEWEVSATGPMFGSRMRWPEREAKAREERVLSAWRIDARDLARFRKLGEGTRRVLRVRPTDLSSEVEPDGRVLVRFTLPSGSYATVAIREVLKDDTLDRPDA